MQRKFLEGLGLEKSIIDKILNENGTDIEKAKERLETERDNYKSQLETAQTALKKFEGVNVEELKGEIEKLNGDLAAKKTEYQRLIASLDLIGQPIKFCVNNNPSSNNKTADCGAIRLSDLPRVNFSFLSAECYARLA